MVAVVARVARYRDNGELIAAVAQLGYLRKEWLTLDPTYGKGTWWREWQPEVLVTHHRPADGSDFTDLPWGDDTFDAVAYDPPYVARGGRKTAGVELQSLNASYGLDDCPATPELLQELIDDGLDEMERVTVPGGIVLVKCQDYVSSGNLFTGTIHVYNHARDLGLKLEDIFEMETTPRVQPHSKQVRVRANTSRLYVFRKPGRRPRLVR